MAVWASKYRKTTIVTARDMNCPAASSGVSVGRLILERPKGRGIRPQQRFKNLEEERQFWDNHDSTDFLDDFEVAKDVVFARPKKEVISLRLDPKIVRKLRELADEEGLPPTTYARMLIVKGIREKAG